jgi:hypothetical protein
VDRSEVGRYPNIVEEALEGPLAQPGLQAGRVCPLRVLPSRISLQHLQTLRAPTRSDREGHAWIGLAAARMGFVVKRQKA